MDYTYDQCGQNDFRLVMLKFNIWIPLNVILLIHAFYVGLTEQTEISPFCLFGWSILLLFGAFAALGIYVFCWLFLKNGCAWPSMYKPPIYSDSPAQFASLAGAMLIAEGVGLFIRRFEIEDAGCLIILGGSAVLTSLLCTIVMRSYEGSK